MTSMYICLHYSLHGYIFITLQVHFYTTVNNRSVKDTTNFNKSKRLRVYTLHNSKKAVTAD